MLLFFAILFFPLFCTISSASTDPGFTIIVYSGANTYKIGYNSTYVIIASNDYGFQVLVDNMPVESKHVFQSGEMILRYYPIDIFCESTSFSVLTSNNKTVVTCYTLELFPVCKQHLFSIKALETAETTATITTEKTASLDTSKYIETDASVKTYRGNEVTTTRFYLHSYVLPLGIGALAFIISYYIVKNRF